MATSAPKSAPKLVTKGPAPGGEEGAPVTKKKSKKKTILMAIISIVVLSIAAAAAFFLIPAGDSPPADPNAPPVEEVKHKAETGKPPRYLVIEPFTVNLQPDDKGEQFLQIAFSLQMTDEKQEELLKQYMPQARSRMLLLLSGKKSSEISTIKGKEKLAEELAAVFKIPFTKEGAPIEVGNVFFTSFVIQ